MTSRARCRWQKLKIRNEAALYRILIKSQRERKSRCHLSIAKILALAVATASRSSRKSQSLRLKQLGSPAEHRGSHSRTDKTSQARRAASQIFDHTHSLLIRLNGLIDRSFIRRALSEARATHHRGRKLWDLRQASMKSHLWNLSKLQLQKKGKQVVSSDKDTSFQTDRQWPHQLWRRSGVRLVKQTFWITDTTRPRKGKDSQSTSSKA